VDPSNPIAYFEEMNRIARESGFKNAQEMLSSQKEMMAMMQVGPQALAIPLSMPVPAQFYPPHMPIHGGFAPPQPYYPPPYIPMDPAMHSFPRGGRGGRFSMRGGRGAGRYGGRNSDHSQPPAVETESSDAPIGTQSSAVTSEGAAPSSGSDEHDRAPVVTSQPTGESNGQHPGGRGPGRGRGRGRGAGRWNEWTADSAQPASATATAPIPSTHNPFAANPFATATAAPPSFPTALAVDSSVDGRFGFAGRSPFAGRGRGRGRVSPVGGNKTWVRPDLPASNPPEQR